MHKINEKILTRTNGIELGTPLNLLSLISAAKPTQIKLTTRKGFLDKSQYLEGTLAILNIENQFIFIVSIPVEGSKTENRDPIIDSKFYL